MTKACIDRLPLTACCLGAVLLGAGWSCEQPVSDASLTAPEAPSHLIVTEGPCASASPARASRLEREGWMRAERYPYDPRDGVLGAARFLEAARCYQAVGLSADATRTSVVAKRLSFEIDADYAAARVALEHALEERSWSNARDSVQRLLALTEHLSPHPYVEWLLGIAALTASRDDPSF